MMEKDKNLEELMAAIGENSTNSSTHTTFPPATAAISMSIPLPISQVNRVANSSSAPPASAPKYGGNVAGNLNELVSLLGGNGPINNTTPTSKTQSAIPSQASSAFPPNPGLPVIPAQQQQRPIAQPQIPTHHATPLDPKAAAQFRRQQLQTASVMQKREPVVGNHVPVPNMTPNKVAQSKQGGDITMELKAMMQNSSSSEASKSTPTRSNQVTQRRPPQRPRPPQPGAPVTSNNSSTVGAHGNTPQRQITQEQIILGHFCRHAMKTLSRVMQGNPARERTEARLKEHIRSVWAQWVRRMIVRQRLLESVASFVRSSCPEALHIDVIGEFKTWYEREFELQKRRTAAAEAEKRAGQPKNLQQQQQQQQQPQQPQQPQQLSIEQVQSTQKQQRKPQNPRAAVNSAGAANPAHVIESKPFAGALPSTGRGAATVNPALKNEIQVATPERSVVKSEPQAVPARTGGKSVSNKTVPARKPIVKTMKGASVAPVAGKSVGSKSVGSKTVPRQPAMQNITQFGIQIPAQPTTKGPPAPAVAQTAAAGGGVAGKTVAGQKGLVANKLLNQPKPKGRKPSTKALPKGTPKPSNKLSPKNVVNTVLAPPKQKVSPSSSNPGVSVALPAGTSSPTIGKRPLDVVTNSPSGSASKKLKPTPKGPRGAVGRKKNPVIVSPASAGRGERPPPAKPDMLSKGRPPLAPGGVASGIGGVGVIAKGVAPASGTSNAGQVPVKKTKGVDDELSVVHNVVDIENEEDMLGRDAEGGTGTVVEVLDYDTDLLLAGPTLRHKMQGCTTRHGLDENISKDCMDMMSLAVRERLASVLESLKDIAAVRMESMKSVWTTAPMGANIFEKLERMRQDEDRSLTVAAEMRVKRRKEQEEKEAKKLAGEAEKEEKKTKDSNAAAEQEKKEKLALEKKRKEHSSQRDALSGLLAGIDKRRKKPNTSKGLAPLEPLSKLGSAGGSKSSGSVLPPIRRVSGAGLPAIGRVDGKGGGKVDPLENMDAQGPLVKLGGSRMSSMPGFLGKRMVEKASGPKRVLTLKDCLFLMESEHNMRKSTLLYKWYGRMGLRELQDVKGS